MNRGKIAVGLFIALAVAAGGLYSWRFFNEMRQYDAMAKRTVPVVTSSPSGQPESVKNFSNIDNNSKAPKSASVSISDSIASVLEPSAKAETFKPDLAMMAKRAAPTRVKHLPQPVAATAPSSQPAELTAAQKRLSVAKNGFDQIMSLAVNYPDAYGFGTGGNLDAAALGGEIPVYTIGLHGKELPVSSLLQPVNEWLYPIILDNQVRYLVQVTFDGHDYVLGHGSRALAAAYEKILDKWPPSRGFHPQIITIATLPSYFFSIPELPQQNITDTDRMLDMNPTLSPASIVLANCQ